MWHRLFLGSSIVVGVLASSAGARAQESPSSDDPPATADEAPPETEPAGAKPAPQTFPLPTPPSTPSPTGRAPETVPGKVYLRPHRSLVALGLGLFGVAFTASAITGGVSDRPSDRWLFAPVVGPWVDLSKRDCSARPCGSNDDVAKSFVVASGLAQAAGLGVLLWGLLTPEIIETRVEVPKGAQREPRKDETRATISIVPSSFVSGAGLAALGTF